MERINLTPSKFKVLPVSYNGADYDIEFDVTDFVVKSVISKMSFECKKIVEKISATEDVSSLVVIRDEAKALATELYTQFCAVVPVFSQVTGGEPIKDIFAWINILSALAEVFGIVRTENAVAERIEEEQGETL